MLKHIASTGAQLLELGQSHGLRSVSARSGDQFMILQIAPDGQAVVGGPQLDLPVDKLMTLASGQVKDFGQSSWASRPLFAQRPGVPGALVAPDGQSTIAGVMWDATGKNLTREQVSKVDGAVPTMVARRRGRRRSKPRRRPRAARRRAFGLRDVWRSGRTEVVDDLRPLLQLLGARLR